MDDDEDDDDIDVDGHDDDDDQKSVLTRFGLKGMQAENEGKTKVN